MADEESTQGSERERPRDERQERSAGRRDRRARKEKVLHTRISEDLADDIRRLADELRVPVSNIVRNVLEEAFSVVEVVTDNVGDLIEDVLGEADAARDRIRRRHGRRRRAARGAAAEDDIEEAEQVGAPEQGFPDVIGWQSLQLHRAQSCGACGTSIERGEQACAGVTARGVGGVFLCLACMEAER